jgi:hypothetical protein
MNAEVWCSECTEPAVEAVNGRPRCKDHAGSRTTGRPIVKMRPSRATRGLQPDERPRWPGRHAASTTKVSSPRPGAPRATRRPPDRQQQAPRAKHAGSLHSTRPARRGTIRAGCAEQQESLWSSPPGPGYEDVDGRRRPGHRGPERRAIRRMFKDDSTSGPEAPGPIAAEVEPGEPWGQDIPLATRGVVANDADRGDMFVATHPGVVFGSHPLSEQLLRTTSATDLQVARTGRLCPHCRGNPVIITGDVPMASIVRASAADLLIERRSGGLR